MRVVTLPFSKKERTVTIPYCKNGDKISVHNSNEILETGGTVVGGLVIVKTANGEVEIGSGSTKYFEYGNDALICPEHVYGILQSAVMKYMYQKRKVKRDSFLDYSNEDKFLDSAWRALINKKNYLGMKRVSGIQRVEMESKLVWF